MGREVDVATRQPTVMQSRCRSPPGLSAWKNAPQRVFVVRDSRCSRVNGNSMRVVDCFSASSGLSCGLPCTGAEVVLRIGCREKLPAACPTKLPHPMAQLDARDVALVSQTIRGVTPIDALIGAPPCDCSGDRVRGASLIVCIARVCVSLRPRCMLIQSATRTLCDADREAERLLVAAGYRVVELRLCAAACGLPLLQRCLFLLAVRDCDPALVQQVEREAEAYSVPHPAWRGAAVPLVRAGHPLAGARRPSSVTAGLLCTGRRTRCDGAARSWRRARQRCAAVHVRQRQRGRRRAGGCAGVEATARVGRAAHDAEGGERTACSA